MKTSQRWQRVISGIAMAGAMVAGLCASPVGAGRAARGQAEPGPQAPTTEPTVPQPPTLPPPTVGIRVWQKLGTAGPPEQPVDIHALIAQFREQLRGEGVKRVVVIGGRWPASGQNAIEDWLVTQVKDALVQGPNGFDLLQDHLSKGSRFGEAVLDTTGADAVVSASLYPNEEGIQITLNGVTSGVVDSEQGTSVALVSMPALLTGEMAALLPPEWKQQIENEQAAPQVPSFSRVTASRFPTCVYCPAPKYTSEAKQLKMAGSLVVAVTVEADGTTHDIQLRRGLGFGLDEAGVEAVSRWRFNPALDKEGNPIATRVTIEVAFRLL